MSLANPTTKEPVLTCRAPDCDERFPKHEAVKVARDGDARSYCSLACYHRAMGREILGLLDHRVCMTCYRLRATVQTPPEGATDAAIGYRYPTPNESSEQGTAFCRCGTEAPHHEHAFLQRSAFPRVAGELVRRVVDLYRRDQIPHPPDKDRFVETIEYDADDGPNWEEAIGAAVYGNP